MMFGQQPYVYQQPIYNQPPMQPMQDSQNRTPYQPQGMPMPQPQAQNYGRNLICVPNRAAVDNYLVCPGETVAFWNVNDPIIYVKKGKSVGGPDTITYDLVERVATPTVPQNDVPSEYVSRKDFDDLAVRVAALEKQGKENTNDEQSSV